MVNKMKPIKKTEIDSKYFRPYVDWLVSQLKKVMLLNEWVIYLKFEDDSHVKSDEHGSVHAEMSVSMTYLNATMTVFPEAEMLFCDGRVQDAFSTVVHELCHIFTQPFWEELHDGSNAHTHEYLRVMWEQQTQRIANVIVQMLLYESQAWLDYKAVFNARRKAENNVGKTKLGGRTNVKSKNSGEPTGRRVPQSIRRIY